MRDSGGAVKIETWRRVANVDIQQLCGDISNATMAEISNWPPTGEGRRLKAASEQAIRALSQAHDKNLDDAIQVLSSVITQLESATSGDFFKTFIAPRKNRNIRWQYRDLGEVVFNVLGSAKNYIDQNRHLLRELANPAPRTNFPGQSVTDVPASLESLIPTQRSGPVQFERRDGVIKIRHQGASTGNRNKKGAEAARIQLLKDAESLSAHLHGSNIDQRIVEIIDDVADHLSAKNDVVQLGITGIAIEGIIPSVEEVASGAIVARLNSFFVGLSLYVAQFDEWHTFVNNAAEIEVETADAKQAYKVASRLSDQLKDQSNLVDPEVPKTLKILLEAIKDPKRASKRAVFAVMRTVENLIAKIFEEFGGFINSVSDGAKEGVKKVATVATVVALLGYAASAAVNISPSAKSVLKTEWLKKASEIVLRQLNDGK